MLKSPALPSILRKSGVAALLAGVAVTGLAACADTPGPSVYSPYEAGAISHVDQGVVIGVRPIQFGQGDTGGGTVVGGVGGAVVGSSLAGRGSRGEGAVLGAIGGALLGHAVASSDRHTGYAYTIRRVRDGSVIEVPQPDANPILGGTRVNIIYEGGRARIVPASDAYAPPPPPPPPPPPRGY